MAMFSKIMLSKLIGSALLLASIASSAAFAQNEQLISRPRIYEAITTDEIVSMMAELQISLTEVSRDAKVTVFEARTATGAVFYTALRGCDYAVTPASCTLVQPYALFKAQGVTLSQINEFNGKKSAGSVGFLMTEDRGVVASKAYFAGGIFALYSVVIHKFATLLIIYGLDLVKITENLYFFLIKQLKVENLNFIQALSILTSFYVILGIIAAVIGLIIGKKALKMKAAYVPENNIEFDLTKDVVHPDGKNRSLLYLIFHIVAIILILTVTNMFSLITASVFTLLYVTFILLKYKRALNYFKRPGFWIQIALFIFIDRKSTRLNSSHTDISRMPSSA